MGRVTENQFLGALLGVAIGDALGLPVTGLSADEVASRHGAFTGYLPSPDVEEGHPASGEISDKTETVLCIVESLTTNDGLLDPENINARLSFIVGGPSRRWMSDATVHGVEDAAGRDGLVSEEVVSPAEPAVAVRGVPVGLLHSIGADDPAAMRHDAAIVTRLSHGGEPAAALTARVAHAIATAARFPDEPARWGTLSAANDAPLDQRLNQIVALARDAEAFEDVVRPVVREGGEASSWGAIAGGIAGVRFGASGIPQTFIDELDARIYLSMAAPWFFRTVMRRAGTVIDLRVIE